MRIPFTVAFALFALSFSSAQQRTISGRFTASDGRALPGVSVVIKGSQIGTTTDADGKYTIEVVVGQTLVFSFVGMTTREVLVTENNLQALSGQRTEKRKSDSRKERKKYLSLSISLYKDSIPLNTVGVTTLSDKAPTYSPKENTDWDAIRAIRQRGNKYIIKSEMPMYGHAFGLRFTSALAVEQINRLPSLQDQYAQGRPFNGNLQWRGADQQEIFSWGPLVRTLEFDGSNYPYDQRGALVPVGTGNGKRATSHDPLSFFQTGFGTVNELIMTVPMRRFTNLVLDFEHSTRSGIIPNTEYNKLHLGASLRNFPITENFNINASATYNKSNGSLLSRGANLSSIIASVYRTPVTFDNANGLPSKEAISNGSAYRLPEGSQRSHAPGMIDHPFGLVHTLPDNEAIERFLSTCQLKWEVAAPVSLAFNGTFDRQNAASIFGIPPGFSGYSKGRLTDRADQQTFIDGIATTTYRRSGYTAEMNLSLSYQTQFTDRLLNRLDAFNFASEESYRIPAADSLARFDRNLSRHTHEIILNAVYEFDSWLVARFTSRNYFSKNTISNKGFRKLLPSVSLSADLARLVDQLWWLQQLKLYLTRSTTMREAPLVYSNWSHNTTTLPLENYGLFYEANELLFHSNLVPERETKFETGLHAHSNRIFMEMAYFRNLTTDLISPVQIAGTFALCNAATTKNYGAAISTGYFGYIRHGNWRTELRWSKYNTVVEKIHSADPLIPLAGFTTTKAALAPGKPFGAIFGTSYLRDPAGKKVIGTDGFPVETTELKMIGNPIPDWMLGWSSEVHWKGFKFSLLFDFRKGGDVWNGTKSALDFLGRSLETAELRNISNYIFDGVDADGNPNTIPVNFSDPSRPVAENRWARYGWDGIGEDYIEDASWIRLNEVVVSYIAKINRPEATIKEISFSLIGRNLFLITPYSGVDPSSILFGNQTGNGLDLFNTPSTRMYTAQISIKI